MPEKFSTTNRNAKHKIIDFAAQIFSTLPLSKKPPLKSSYMDIEKPIIIPICVAISMTP